MRKKNNALTARHKSQSHKLSCIYFNARSLRNKLEVLDGLVISDNYDIIFITETWFDSTVSNAQFSYNQTYNIERTDRTDRKGGGCAILYRNNSSLQAVAYQQPVRFSDVEVCAIDVLGSVQTRFVCVYMAPDVQNNISLGMKYFDYLQLLSQTDLK